MYLYHLSNSKINLHKCTCSNLFSYKSVDFSKLTCLYVCLNDLWQRLSLFFVPQILLGTASDVAHWKTCVSYINENYGMALGRLFIRDNFREESKEHALSMIDNIRAAFIDLLDHVDWMDAETRSKAIDKVTTPIMIAK